MEYAGWRLWTSIKEIKFIDSKEKDQPIGRGLGADQIPFKVEVRTECA